MSQEFFSDRFVKYKKVDPILSVSLCGGKKEKKFHVVNTDKLTEDDVNNYSLGSDIESIKNPGYFLPEFPVYNPNKIGDSGQRLIVTLTGKSGSGKTTLCTRLAKNWLKANKKCPHKKIILITPKLDCDDLLALNPCVVNVIERDKIITNLINDDTRLRYTGAESGVPWENNYSFVNALVIIDDMEGISTDDEKLDKKIVNNICGEIIRPILTKGRHDNCSLLFIKHNSTLMNDFYRLVNEESDYVAIFPRISNRQRIIYIMKKHFMLPDKHIKHVLSTNPWYILQHMAFPSYTICERSIHSVH